MINRIQEYPEVSHLCQGFLVPVLPCGISASLHLGMPERTGDRVEQGTAERDRTAQLPDGGFHLASKMWQGPITTDTQTAKVSSCIQSYCLFPSFPPSPSFWKEECMLRVNFHSLSLWTFHPQLHRSRSLFLVTSWLQISHLSSATWKQTPPPLCEPQVSATFPNPCVLAAELPTPLHLRLPLLSLLALSSVSCVFPAFIWNRAPG